MPDEDFLDLKHSIRILDSSGKALIDIDKEGVTNNSEGLNVCVCKTIGQINGWEEVKMIYASQELKELAKRKKE